MILLLTVYTNSWAEVFLFFNKEKAEMLKSMQNFIADQQLTILLFGLVTSQNHVTYWGNHEHQRVQWADKHTHTIW